MELIEIVFGDWGDDGHGKTESFVIHCSHNLDAIREAYKKASQATGFKFDRICCEYQDRKIKPSDLEKIKSLGWEGEVEDDGDWMTCEDMFSMLKFMVQLGNPEIKFKDAKIQTWNTGFGYGLFY